MERQILHSDMNNFYASVECMLDHKLRDKIVAVCGSQEERKGIVLAANYKAKSFGIKTGDVIWQGKQKCRDLTIVPPNYEAYMKFSGKAKEIYNRYTQQVESFGMDECWLDVTGSQVGNGYEIAEKIRETIQFELGLTVSIGVSFNKIFAKLGSDMKKPNAVTVIPRETFQEQIWSLPACDLLGVGRSTQIQLSKHGIKTIGDLAKTEESFLKKLFGVNGLKLKVFANGLDKSLVAEIDHSIPMKTIGHGITAIQDLETPYEVWCLILWLAQSLGRKLRKYKKKACGVAISIKSSMLTSCQFQCKINYPTQSATVIAQECFSLFQLNYSWYASIRAITVRAIYLQDENAHQQMDLFTDMTKLNKMERIDKSIADIRRRYGENAIFNACLYEHRKIPKQSAVEITMPTGFL